MKLSGYARFGAVWTEGAPAVAAKQGVHTAASAAIAGAVAGAPVVAADSAALFANLTAAQATAAAAAHNQASAAALTAANAAVTAAAAAIAASAGTPATAAVADSTDVASRVRFQLDASTTTDAGIGLNVRQRIQTAENGTNDTNGARFGLTYNGLSLNVGNIKRDRIHPEPVHEHQLGWCWPGRQRLPQPGHQKRRRHVRLDRVQLGRCRCKQRR